MTRLTKAAYSAPAALLPAAREGCEVVKKSENPTDQASRPSRAYGARRAVRLRRCEKSAAPANFSTTLPRLCRPPCGKAAPYRATLSHSSRLRRRPRHLCKSSKSTEWALHITLSILAATGCPKSVRPRRDSFSPESIACFHCRNILCAIASFLRMLAPIALGPA
jgi:hypothetical protein